ncbi:putative AAA ATPase [Skeletonema marinoi]|uniref:AAA ATPase n=1 Tax=Skeletonema marinoi TaxID=267567 RepID=A0AAD9DD95_9STRA|nr:putative AAA ATPase [Skeletonema marinoi]
MADTTLFPLRSWIESEADEDELHDGSKKFRDLEEDNNTPNNSNKNERYKESIIRRTTIAYGIAELLKRSSNENGELDEANIIRIDNFTVSISNSKQRVSSRSWDDIEGVGMISSGLSLMIEEPSYLRGLLEREENCDGQMLGRCLEVELTSAVPQEHLMTGTEAEAATVSLSEQENNRCNLFARLLYELFSCEPFPDDALAVDADATPSKEGAQKRAKSHDMSSRKNLMLTRARGDFDRAEMPFQIRCIVRMLKLGIPASICLMTQNLLESALREDGGQLHDAYESLRAVGEDLHLLLLDPDRFLFDDESHSIQNDVQLLYRKDKLYGRDKEETLITDAFCRVSRGKSEAFFIGGFSGSGKSMLVNSLRDRVKCVGGYTIKHKFDPMSQEKPLSGVISAFNQICLMIKGRARPVIAKKLGEEFGVDFSLLMRLLPNVSVLLPEHVRPVINVDAGEAMNARSVCFTLLRFVRVVSSPSHPVMLFLDDIQWADSTALDVIHTILSDTKTMGSCMLFVGAYRDNEVQVDHPIFDLMEKLEISNVQTTKVSLSGLDQEDLNTMISDALCLYPRICKSLSGIVFQKTKGSPFFVLEFMQSLKSRGLLEYNFHQKRWVWNEDIIRAEDITDNVLHLVSSKMDGLSDNVQTLLKIMACFGSCTSESVIGYLNESVEYAEVLNGLEGALIDGFIVKEGEGSLQFVHDKVREAAYNLIPKSDKKQFHYHLGKALNSICDGKDVGDIIFLIASLINHGKEWILRDEELSIAFAKLNMKAGKRALDGCDHKTAYSYLEAALSLLPQQHWENHYDLSLRLNFLMAGAAKSCCQYVEAEQMLRKISERCRCFEDKLSSYYLLSQIFLTQGRVVDAYDTCSFVLLQLGETIPDLVAFDDVKTIAKDTLTMYEEVDDDDWLERKMEDETFHTKLQFYTSIAYSSFFCKSYSLLVYFTCKAVQLSLQKGICEHTPLSLLQFTGVVANNDNAVLCYRIAKNALSLQERFDVAAQVPELYNNFYGRFAWRFEPFQVCVNNLRRGFEIGFSSGNNDMGLQCAFQLIKTNIFSGSNLKSLLNEIDYYLHFFKTFQITRGINVLVIFRETVSVLIDKGQATSIEAKAAFEDLNDPENRLRGVLYFHKAIQAYWSGYTERCQYYIGKYLSVIGQDVRLSTFQMEFYHGLNSIDKWRGKNSFKCREIVRKSISAMKEAAANSDWNFTNKLCLLEAERQSLSYNHRQAIASYDASITSARKSGFIHEQGLACEKAGFYHKRYGDVCKAAEYFKQARECYEEWGSSMKVDFIQGELNNVQILVNSELARRGQ